uniref:Senescence regulator n=1 Tax=Oryza punctata TaxID=4537 RepID=A0A0E0M7M7_ORYPU
MDSAARTRRSPPAERFLGMFASPDASLPTSPTAAGDELLEGDLLFAPAPSSDSPPPTSPDASSKPGRVPGGHVGLLAALHEGDRRLSGRGGAAAVATAGAAGALLRRKATIAAASAAASSAQTQSPPSAARAIPSVPRARYPEQPPAVPYHQSAPVKVPVRPPPPRRSGWDHLAGVPGDGYDDDDEELLRGDAAMLPPHEMVARASAGGGFGGPVKPSSMLEGVGRTLKGRDLRRVRDAVLRQTGFLD